MGRSSVLPVTSAAVTAPMLAGPAPTLAGPVPESALDLLRRSDAELLAAQLASSPEDQFLHAHLSALRAAAAVLQVTGRPSRRPAPRTAWDMLSLVVPELAPWSTYFAAGAATRSAVEAGRDGAVDAERAERTLAAAEDFQDAVRVVLGQGVTAAGPERAEPTGRGRKGGPPVARTGSGPRLSQPVQQRPLALRAS